MQVWRITGILFCLIRPDVGQEIKFPKTMSSRFCLTPSGQKGRCTDIRKCSHTLHDIKKGETPTFCRFKAHIPEVCCSKSFGTLEGRTPEILLEIDSPETTSLTDCGMRFPNLRFRRAIEARSSVPTASRSSVPTIPVSTFAVGGQPSMKHTWPWMVLLVRSRGEKKDYFCGGAIINENYVITAAHCVLSLEPFYARTGEHDYKVDQGLREDIDIEDVIFHPKYELDKGYHDIALLKLAKNITFRDHVKPICLPWRSLLNEDLVGKPVTIAGWGKLEFGGLASPVLQEVNVTVFHSHMCNKSYSTLPDYAKTFPEGITPDNIICAGHIEGDKDSCDGDSGGPLMHYEKGEGRYTLAAIISKGFGCGKKNFPGLNAPIRNRETLQWIKSVVFQ